MKNMMALLGIATALLVGCAADEPQERTPIAHKLPADFDLVQVAGGTGEAPSAAIIVKQFDGVHLGNHQPQDFVEMDQEVIIVDDDGASLSTDLGQVTDLSAHGMASVGGANEQIGELSPLPSDTPDACECDTEECVNQWIDQNLGCNVCVLFTCGDEPFAAGCNACP